MKCGFAVIIFLFGAVNCVTNDTRGHGSTPEVTTNREGSLDRLDGNQHSYGEGMVHGSGHHHEMSSIIPNNQESGNKFNAGDKSMQNFANHGMSSAIPNTQGNQNNFAPMHGSGHNTQDIPLNNREQSKESMVHGSGHNQGPSSVLPNSSQRPLTNREQTTGDMTQGSGQTSPIINEQHFGKPTESMHSQGCLHNMEHCAEHMMHGSGHDHHISSVVPNSQDTVQNQKPLNNREQTTHSSEHSSVTDGNASGKPIETSETNQGPDSDKNMKTKEEEKENEVCFKQLGCFSMGAPWKSVLRPISAPFAPEKIQTTLIFYSRGNLEKGKNITLQPRVNMGDANFNPNKITLIIVHGFANSGNATWMKDLKNAYLKHVDANAILVDWGKGAQLLNYLQVAGNTRVVGKQLGLFVKYLMQKHGADPGKFHLIGHSLGAHICSYLAKTVPGIARLTALDPAQPGFEGFSKEVRLDVSDAEFVDVVHTDARPFLPTLGFGMITPHGHVDFYMNGGFDQPGCIPPAKKELPAINNILDLAKYPVELISKIVACPHGRAYEYIIEAFKETEKCIFWGHKADVKNVLKTVTNTVTQGLLKKFVALSSTCSKEDCIPLGFATKKSPLKGTFVVTTAARSPYCISEEGVPPESPRAERESFIQKIAKKTKTYG